MSIILKKKHQIIHWEGNTYKRKIRELLQMERWGQLNVGSRIIKIGMNKDIS